MIISRTDRFVNRHNGPDNAEIELMLETIGADSLAQLIAETVPASIRLAKPLSGLEARTEVEFLEDITAIASKNKIYKSYI